MNTHGKLTLTGPQWDMVVLMVARSHPGLCIVCREHLTHPGYSFIILEMETVGKKKHTDVFHSLCSTSGYSIRSQDLQEKKSNYRWGWKMQGIEISTQPRAGAILNCLPLSDRHMASSLAWSRLCHCTNGWHPDSVPALTTDGVKAGSFLSLDFSLHLQTDRFLYVIVLPFVIIYYISECSQRCWRRGWG